MKRVRSKLYASGVALLNPGDCASLVQYRITRSRWGGLSGEIALRDCTKTITWGLSVPNSDDSCCVSTVEKIERAIHALIEARDAWVAAELAEDRRKRRRRKAK